MTFEVLAGNKCGEEETSQDGGERARAGRELTTSDKVMEGSQVLHLIRKRSEAREWGHVAAWGKSASGRGTSKGQHCVLCVPGPGTKPVCPFESASLSLSVHF